jgi:hypothetical protein
MAPSQDVSDQTGAHPPRSIARRREARARGVWDEREPFLSREGKQAIPLLSREGALDFNGEGMEERE